MKVILARFPDGGHCEIEAPDDADPAVVRRLFLRNLRAERKRCLAWLTKMEPLLALMTTPATEKLVEGADA